MKGLAKVCKMASIWPHSELMRAVIQTQIYGITMRVNNRNNPAKSKPERVIHEGSRVDAIFIYSFIDALKYAL